MEANVKARPDVRDKLREALEVDNSIPARIALEQLLENLEIAGRGSLPMCQDCGYATVFVEIGQDIKINGAFNEAVQAGVALGYRRGNLRRSVIKHALSDRAAPEEERPAKVYTDITPGDKFRLTVMPKGGGSDNASRLAMLRPTAGEDEIVELALKTVAETGVNACPPLFIGLGVGGSFDSVALIAKKALLRDFREPLADPAAAALEERVLREVNALGIGPGGLGGMSTALGVAVAIEPTHMACLPVAVNVSCNQLRSASGEL